MAVKYVTIEYCKDPMQAEFLKSYLVTNGVRAKLSNEDRLGFTGRYSVMSRGVKLTVPEDQAEEARGLIAEAEAGRHALTDEDLDAFAEGELEDYEAPPSYVPTECPNCAASDIQEDTPAPATWIVLNILFLGIPWLFHKPSWSCRSCGWHWSKPSVFE